MKPCSNKTLLPGSFFLVLLLLFTTGNVSYAQVTQPDDTLSKAFYDSLRVRAERRKLTSLIYDMVVVTPNFASNARVNMTSTSPFEEHEGKIIRNREVIRLNAFGTNIDNPEQYDPSRSEKILNSTYTKTKRFILNQYILFREGDTISSLEMSDNERLLRQLPFIDDAHITVIPVDSTHADIAIIVRENYPYGLNLGINKITSGSVRIYDKNFAGLGHEMTLSFPYNFDKYAYPGFGAQYSIRNIARSFSDVDLEFGDGLGSTVIKGAFSRRFVTSETKYAWSAYLKMIRTTEDLDTMTVPAPLSYTWQDYWVARAFMLDRTKVTRLIITGRYIRNNVFSRPEITDFSYYRLQNYQMVTSSMALSSQRFINTSLIYSYGRTEDIPYGYMIEVWGGREKNEFKWRTYAGMKVAIGNIIPRLGYIYAGAGISSFIKQEGTEQGMLEADFRYFTPLVQAGRSKIRTFVNLYYTRGFNRYTDESLYLNNNSLIRGFHNDSISGGTRIICSVEPVLFIHKPLVGFRFALFAFADAGLLVRDGFNDGGYYTVPALGAGIRIRNDQLVLNTIQIRLAWYPNSPPYSEKSWITAGGIVRLRPPGFEPDPPGVTPYQ